VSSTGSLRRVQDCKGATRSFGTLLKEKKSVPGELNRRGLVRRESLTGGDNEVFL
jgi:hypothetical protein